MIRVAGDEDIVDCGKGGGGTRGGPSGGGGRLNGTIQPPPGVTGQGKPVNARPAPAAPVNTNAPRAQGLGNSLTTNQHRLNHMFRDSPGHFTNNTTTNRNLIENTANDSRNFLGTDRYGVQWFAQTQADGTQVWAKVRGGVIVEAGLNQAPRIFNPQTGLNAPHPPSIGGITE